MNLEGMHTGLRTYTSIAATLCCITARLALAQPAVATPLSFQPASLHAAPLNLSQKESIETPDKEKVQSNDFTVTVRAIHAEGFVSDLEKRDPATVEIDPRLVDVQEKLLKFPYKTFRLISEESSEVELRQKDTLRLSNGQRLCLRAVDTSPEQVMMWFRWRDADDSTLLDTRMNFLRDEPMVAGVESKEENSGVILAVKVS